MKQMQHLQHKPKKMICQQKKQLGYFGVENRGERTNPHRPDV